jgi:DNA-binding response OmpR family regulator
MKRILIVDDEPGVAKGLRLSLEQEGYAVSWAPDGKEGLAKVAEGNFDLVLLDLMLPEVDGLTVCREIRARRSTPRGDPAALLTLID